MGYCGQIKRDLDRLGVAAGLEESSDKWMVPGSGILFLSFASCPEKPSMLNNAE